MVKSNINNQNKITQKINKLEQKNDSYNKQRYQETLNKKRAENKRVAKKTAIICSIVLLGVIFLVYVIGAFLGLGYKKDALFASDVLAVENQDGKWGYINRTGQTMINFEYDNAFNFSENGRALVGKDGKWGFIDINGKMVIAAEYDDAMPFEYGVAIVAKNGKYGFIDKNGNVLSKNPTSKATELCFDTIFAFEQEYSSKKFYAVAVFDGQYGVIDNAGNVVIEFKYDELGYSDANIGEDRKIGNAMISYRLDDGWGYVDYTGNEVCRPIYDIAYSFDDIGWAIVYKDTEYWIVYLNEEGRLMDVYHDIYTTNFIDRFDNGYYRIQNNENLYGLIKKNPNAEEDAVYVQAINNEYTYLEYGNDEVLVYSKGTDQYSRKYGFMDYSGATKTDEIYTEAYIAGDQLITTKEDENGITVLNNDLTVAFNLECDEISDFHYGVAVFMKNNMFGYVCSNGKVICEATLLLADDFKSDGFAVARNADGYGVLNAKGKWQIGAIYQGVSHFAFDEV